MNKQELINKVEQIENQITNIKNILKDQAKHIGQYHKVLKEISSQLLTVKEKLIYE